MSLLRLSTRIAAQRATAAPVAAAMPRLLAGVEAKHGAVAPSSALT
eukprot:CAMPEP_0206451078 /NCGR_PEP_ID=MMETSP0324_2-20121206/19117_1 /ASSEMBLY_ACC=CAM_ASM_000836 /TAXON_ID=2866 /ORGANISM="Crypthecodinium cohnii, Strain Seligo" /LENGTH=45 /DNA_ID= /DNA_START= /DNA_END= /DNA_ORIENTATION=